MAKHAISFGESVPGSTDVALRKTGSSPQKVTKSEGSEAAAAPPSSTKIGPEFSFDPEDPLDGRTREVLMTIGGLMGGSFSSSSQARLLVRQMKKMGLHQEALAFARGYAKMRTDFMQGFMG
tara:strand:+ start:6858 stop:7223 length:366 start_codon:yes stop_codon:yes gene_type:complete